MWFIRNMLAFVGLLVVIAVIAAATRILPHMDTLVDMDPAALQTYADMALKLLDTGSIAQATVWKVPVQAGLTAEDVDQTMKVVANEHNIKNVGELPLYKQVSAMTGKSYRFLKIYMFCNPLTAARMVDYDDAFSAYLPCRVSLVQDKSGRLWLYSLNMDLMIHGGRTLPPDLRKEALAVRGIILDIMRRGAAGDF